MKGGFMTRNQLTLQANLEQARSNRANEAEAQRHNLASESEISRHNVATEVETNRHNLETEKWQMMTLEETKRYNTNSLALTLQGLNETARSNIQKEKQAEQKLQIDQFNAQTERQKAEVSKYAAQQTARIGALNAQTARLQAFTARDSVTQNALNNLMQNKLGYANLAETARQNDLNYAIQVQRNDEARRHNIFSELNDTGYLSNDMRKTNIQQFQAETGFELQSQQNLETIRHNTETEKNQRKLNDSTQFKNYSSGISELINTVGQFTKGLFSTVLGDVYLGG